MAGVQLVQQGALQLEARGLRVLALDIDLQGVLQGVQIAHAKALGEAVVQRRFNRGLHRLHLDREFRRLALQPVDAVVRREGHLHRFLIAGRGAGQLLLEAGDELARADHQLGVLGRAALKGLAVDAADEIDGQLVAVTGFHGFARALLVGAALLGQIRQRLGDLGGLRLIDQPLQLQLRDVDRLEIRHHLDVQLVVEVLLAGQHLVHVRLRRQVRGRGGAQAVILQHLLAGLVDGLLDQFAHQRLAVDTAHVRHRHLAGTEAADVQPRSDLGDLGFELFGQVGRADLDAIDAAQAFA